MSSYSFSHQFYQRWTCAPEPIRAAITQELKDITTLLQNETPFESFEFQTHDLDAHIDELYENHEAEQAIAKAIADKQTQERAAAEKERLEEEQRVQAAEDSKLKAEAETKSIEEAKLREQEKAAQKEQNQLSATDKNNRDASVVASSANAVAKVTISSNRTNRTEKNNIVENVATENHLSEQKTISEHAKNIDDSAANSDKHAKNDNSIKIINDKASAAISLALKDVKAGEMHQALIRELEVQIDDYLSDQMMLMSENLKSWLRAEVAQNLGDQDKSETSKKS